MPSGMAETTHVSLTITALTPQAVRALVGEDMVWLPKSCIVEGVEDIEDAWLESGYGTTVDVEVVQWKARELGL